MYWIVKKYRQTERARLTDVWIDSYTDRPIDSRQIPMQKMKLIN